MSQSLMSPPPPAVTRGKALCGAKKRSAEGGLCTRPAGWGTDHAGTGRCKFHGGRNPVRHGRYSVIQRPRIAALVKEFEADPNPLDTLPEIHLVRALLADGIERYDEITAATLAWHASYAAGMRPLHPSLVDALGVVLDELEALAGPFEVAAAEAEGGDAVATAVARTKLLLESLRTPADLKPRVMPDLTDLHTLAESATRMVERVQKAKSAMYITRRDFFRVMGEMGRVVELSNGVADPDTRLDAIRDGWKAVRLG